MYRGIFIFFLAFVSLSALGADVVTHTGRVTQVAAFPHAYGSYDESQKGRLAIYVEGLPAGCGSGHGRVVIGVDHPIYNSVVTLALTAKASQSDVLIAYFEECTIRGGSWDLAYLTLK